MYAVCIKNYSPSCIDYERFEQPLKVDSEFESVEISIDKMLKDNGQVDVLKKYIFKY